MVTDSTALPVAFYMPELDDVAGFEKHDPDRDWHEFGQAAFMTVGQSYIRLRDAGYPVRLVNRPPDKGIVVVFGPNIGQLLEDCRDHRRLLIVCLQADRRLPQILLADVIVRHNSHGTDGHRRVFMPNWVQGGLVKRDPSRGTRIHTIDYKGRTSELHPMFSSDTWEQFLHARGVDFVIDNVGELKTRYTFHRGAMRWNDYSDVDLVLAVRPDLDDPYLEKPAVKLINAWTAGVPALMGPEYAYRELRRSELDYVEVDSLDSACAAVDRLLAEPDHYQAMVENGLERARDYTVERNLERWERLLFDGLASWHPNRLVRTVRPLLRPARRTKRQVGSTLRRVAS